MTPTLFQTGLTQFNQGDFFKAHETWEEAWNDSWGVEKRTLQALIKMSVALLKWQSEIPGGAIKLYEAAKKNFAELPDTCLELDIRKVEGNFTNLLTPLLIAKDPKLIPFPKEIFQLSLLSKIT